MNIFENYDIYYNINYYTSDNFKNNLNFKTYKKLNNYIQIYDKIKMKQIINKFKIIILFGQKINNKYLLFLKKVNMVCMIDTCITKLYLKNIQSLYFSSFDIKTIDCLINLKGINKFWCYNLVDNQFFKYLKGLTKFYTSDTIIHEECLIYLKSLQTGYF